MDTSPVSSPPPVAEGVKKQRLEIFALHVAFAAFRLFLTMLYSLYRVLYVLVV